MKKILTVFDSGEFDEGIFDFIEKTNSSSSVLLTAVFLRSIDYASVWNYPLFINGYISGLEVETEIVLKNIKTFESICIEKGIKYKVHNDTAGEALAMLKMETRFSDVLVMSSDFFYKDTYLVDPGAYLKDTLHEAECPVLLLPSNFEVPIINILAYDGSSASMFAIKQFAMLFPEWCGNDTYLIYMSKKGDGIPDRSRIEEYATQHFPSLVLNKLNYDPEKYLNSWLEHLKGTLLITGAYNRSELSEFFKRSFANDVINDNKVPIFIAHK